MNKPIELTSSGFWHELEALVTSGELTPRLADYLKSLASSHWCKTIPPHASAEIITEAKERLTQGFVLSDSALTLHYDIMVYVPDRDKEATQKTFFVFVRKYPHGQLMRLSEL